MTDVIWALQSRDRLIACPSKPTANAVVLLLSGDGDVHREDVERWASAGLMVAQIAWPGSGHELTEDDIADLQDAADGLVELATVVGVAIDEQALDQLRGYFADSTLAYLGPDDLRRALDELKAAAPVQE